MRAALTLLVLLVACPSAEPAAPPEPAVSDAAVAQRVALLTLGRRPLGAGEQQVLAAVVAERGAGGLVRALARSAEYREHQADVVYDLLEVDRLGLRSNGFCYGVRARDGVDGSLASAVSATVSAPAPGGAWTMADLVRDALVADDLAPVFRAHLMADLIAGLRPPNLLEAQSQRQARVEAFTRSLGRDLECLPCHNSQASVTDHPDPELDRTWPVPGTFEAAAFGASEGRPSEDLWTLFRRRGVLAGFRLGTDLAVGDALVRVDACQPLDGAGCGGCPCEAAVCAEDPVCCSGRWTERCAQRCQELGGCRAQWPPFDGCTEVVGDAGCNGCACEAAVCAQDASCCEQEWGIGCASLCAEQGGCAVAPPEPVTPWGMHSACGLFLPPDRSEPALGGRAAWLTEDLGDSASVWDVEALLGAGMDGLKARGGLATGDVDGPEALASLLAMHVADELWFGAMGSRLTVAHGFPRNPEQAARLERLGDAFARRFSLVDLLVAIAEDPLFALPAPAAYGGSSLTKAPVLDPFAVDAQDEADRGNGPGDALRRLPARVWQRAAGAALGWQAARAFFPVQGSAESDAQGGIGVFLGEGQPGFHTLGFQTLLSWESTVGRCERVLRSSSAPGCAPKPEPGCAGCLCEDWADFCDVLPHCCESTWDDFCVAACERGGGCPLDVEEVQPDWIDGLAAEGLRNREALAVLEDRLLGAAGDLEPEWQDLVGAFDEAATEDGLRAACAVLLASPQFLLDGLPAREAEVPARAETAAQACQRLVAGGASLSCD